MIGVPVPSRTTRLALRLVAAKQDIVNMGFPKIISKLLYEKYGKLAPLVAKWYKQYHAAGSLGERPYWWRGQYVSSRGISIVSMVRLYEEGVNPKSFRQIAKHEDIEIALPHTQWEVDEFRQELLPDIRDQFLGDIFFNYSSLMKDISSGKFTDVAPYRKLQFRDAEIKYDERRHFEQTMPLKVYDNGFKWIDAGQRSVVLSNQMKNCGSAGVMSLDKDRTILALFGPTNKPHVMVTYSPNEKRISGDECAGSTEVKPEYHQYVIDLAEHLGATFDASKSRSTELGLKYRLRNKAQSIEKLETPDSFDSYFKFVIDGKAFYTNGTMVASEDDVNRAKKMVESGELESNYSPKEVFKDVLNVNRHYVMEDHGINVISLYGFLGEGVWSE